MGRKFFENERGSSLDFLDFNVLLVKEKNAVIAYSSVNAKKDKRGNT